jgi:hypothetical protein
MATFAMGALGCAASARLGARVLHVEQALAAAEAGGAMRCAPRELAIAQSHAAFARMEWEQGDTASADAHLDIADENVRAARLLSVPGRCGDPDDAAGARPEPAPGAPPAPMLLRSHAR